VTDKPVSDYQIRQDTSMRVLNANVRSFTFLYIIMAEHNRRGSSCQQWPDRERERETEHDQVLLFHNALINLLLKWLFSVFKRPLNKKCSNGQEHTHTHTEQ